MIPTVTPDQRFRLLVDPKSKRPAGMFLQIVYGCEVSLLNLFEQGAILNAVTPDIRFFDGTLAEWQQFAEQCNREARS